MLLCALWYCCLYLSFSSKVWDHLRLLLLALFVVVEEHVLEVRSPGDGSVEPLPGGVRELVVKDGDGILDGAALQGVAGPTVVMHEVLLD